ncbi:MAG TPA: citrate/2-methylcitrate synthase, partial [Candidatus Faecivivens stercorigallinarum]|nr:citrate/2-methylcitrate synthase [Candidatus Faecivivens stercorigallinarum]
TLPYELYDEYQVKKGLRDKNGDGVRAGLTNISRIESFDYINGERIPCDGRLYYRGINVQDLVRGFLSDDRFGFEETAYLLLFGRLPDAGQLEEFTRMLAAARSLPRNFTRDVLMKGPSRDVMISLSKSVLMLASYDRKTDDISIENVLLQCLRLISVFPMISVYGYHAYNHYIRGKSMYIHRPLPELSTAENFLRMLRPDKKYSPLEAKILDLALVLHMEHGGGNNSTFTTHVVSSSGTDTYSTIAAALGSLKGPKHGGANIRVVQMMKDLKAHVHDTRDEEEVAAYLLKLLNKEAFDKKGLIYGMGHAVYTKSDPRCQIFKKYVGRLSEEKGRRKDYELYTMVERLAPKVIAENRRIYKGVSANVDFYSGLIYSMLDIPEELFTPMFAIARIVGWSAHRLEELINVDKIIRPAYISVGEPVAYQTLSERNGNE